MSNKSYYLSKQGSEGIEISAARFKSLKKAKLLLTAALEMEQVYAVLIEAYVDFEKEMLDIGLEAMVYQRWDYDHYSNHRITLNLRLLSLLTAASLYKNFYSGDDSNPSAEKKMSQNLRNASTQACDLFYSEYSNDPWYRFIYELRNHAQHNALPIDIITYGSSWTVKETNGPAKQKDVREHSIDLWINKLALQERGFTHKVLDSIDEKIDLKFAVRHYVEQISGTHQKIRDLIDSEITAKRKLIEEALIDCGATDNRTLGAVLREHEGDQVTQKLDLFFELEEVRIKLQQKNRELVCLPIARITSLKSK